MSDEATSRGWDTVLANAQVAIFFGAIYYAAFEVFRRYKNGKTPAYGGNMIVQERRKKVDRVSLPYRPKGLLGWISAIRQIGHGDDLEEAVGLDAYVVLRYLRLHVRLCGVSVICGCILLMPVYDLLGTGLDDPFYRTTMSNLPRGSVYFWVPAILGFFYGLHSLYYIGLEYKNYVRHRNKFMAWGAPNVDPQARYSIMVENVPSQLRSQALLRGYFEYLFPGLVHSAVMGVQGPDIHTLQASREDVARLLETAYVQETNYPEKRPVMVRPPYSDMDKCMEVYRGGEAVTGQVGRFVQCCALCGCCGCGCCAAGKVEAIAYYEEILRRLNEETAARQKELLDELHEVEVIGTSTLPPLESTQVGSKDFVGTDETRKYPRKEKSGSRDGFVGRVVRFFGMDDDDNLAEVEEAKLDERDEAEEKADMTDERTPLKSYRAKSAREFYSGEDPQACEEVADRTDGVCQRMASTAFVTFTTLKAKQTAMQVLLSNHSHIKAVSAPVSSDVVWHDMHRPLYFLEKRRLVARILFTTLFILFSFPVAACASASLDTLEAIAPFLSTFRGNYLYTTLGSFLPTILSVALLAVVPMLIRWSAEHFEFFKTGHEIEAMLFERNYNLVLVYTYISLTAGSVLDALADIIGSPASILTLLGTTVPGTAAYFMGVLAVDSAGAFAELANVPGHLIYWYFSRNGDDDLGPRDLEKRDTPTVVEYGMVVPQFMLVALVAYLLELICPALQIFALFYFFVHYLVWKHQFLYVYDRPAESGGKIVFFRLYKRTFTAIFTGQLTLIAYLLIREAFWPAMFSTLPPFVTFCFMTHYRHKYERPAEVLSYEKAVFVDGDVTFKDLDDFDENIYLQPVLKDSEPAVAEKPRKYGTADSGRRGSIESLEASSRSSASEQA